MIAGISFNGGTNTTLTAPAGWTLISKTNNGSNVGVATYYKVAGGSETSSYSWTISSSFGTSPRAAGGIVRYTGTSGVDVSSAATGITPHTSTDPSLTAPSVTTTAANDVVVNFFALDDNSNFTAVSGSSERYDVSNTSGPAATADEFAKATAGSTGTKTVTANGTHHDTNWAAQTIALKMAIVNTAPVANAASLTTNEDTSAGITLTATDAESNPLTYAVVSNPLHGSLSGSAPNLTYTPNANYHGSDSFTFKANDGLLDSVAATVSITVISVNDDPVGVADAYSTDEDTALTVAVPGVLGNDSDVDGDTIDATKLTDPSHGSLDFNTDGSFVYTPNANFNGVDTFTYEANDQLASSGPVTVTISVGAENDIPQAVGDSYSVNEDASLSVAAAGVLANDTDGDNDALTAALVTGPAHGTLTLNADGSFDYTPVANYSGSDSFSYKANDGTVDSASAIVDITVTPINDAPTVVLIGSNPINLTVGDVFVDPGATGSDVEDGSIAPVVTGSVDTATAGTYTLTYTVTDSGSLSASTTRDVIVAAAQNNGGGNSGGGSVTLPQCSDGIDNDNDGKVDFPADNSCFDKSDNSEGEDGGGGGGGTFVPFVVPGNGGGSVGGGSVLGTSTGPTTGGSVLGTSTSSCTPLLSSYVGVGKKNNIDDIKKLQNFLNSNLGLTLEVNGNFGQSTLDAVNAFQLKYSDEVLKPWVAFGLPSDHTPTGYVYKTTSYKINKLVCGGSFSQPFPQLP